MQNHVCTHMQTHTHTSVSCGLKPAGMYLSGSAKLQSVVELEIDSPCLLWWVFWLLLMLLPGMHEFDHSILVPKDIMGVLFLSPKLLVGGLLGEAEKPRELDLHAQKFPLLSPACATIYPPHVAHKVVLPAISHMETYPTELPCPYICIVK